MEDMAFFGDWNNDGADSPGVRRGNTFLLRDGANTGTWDYAIAWGQSTDVAFVGDWDGDGVESLGLRRGTTVYLSNDGGDGQPNPAGVDFDVASTYATYTGWGLTTDVPVIGDWDNNGTDTIALKRGNVYYFSTANVSGPGAYWAIAWGQANDDAVSGDWDNNGTDTLGLKRGNIWYLAANNNTGSPQAVPAISNETL